MPVKRRRSKLKPHNITPEVLAAFEAEDERALRAALKLPPWSASPLWTDLEGPPPYGPSTMLVNATRPAALAIRKEILAALGQSD